MRACRRPPSEFWSSIAITRQLLNIGNSSPRDISVIVTLSINDGFFSGLLRVAVSESRIEDVGESLRMYAVCRYCAIVCAIKTLNQSRDSGWWEEWCSLCLPYLEDT